MIRTKSIISLAFVAGCLLAVARPALAQHADITGTWELTVTPPNGTERIVPLVLKNDAGKIAGTVSLPQAVLPVEATVKEKAVTLALTAPTQNGPLNLVLVGTAEGEPSNPASSMSGTVELGAQGQAKWIAKRTATPAPAPAATTVDVTGAWAFAVEFGGGSGTPTMTFKQDGEKLTGQYVGQLGEAPLSGTLKGERHRLHDQPDDRGQCGQHSLYRDGRRRFDEGRRETRRHGRGHLHRHEEEALNFSVRLHPDPL